MCAAKQCRVSMHNKVSLGSLLPSHTYIYLAGHLVHSFPVLDCCLLSQDTIDWIQKMSLSFKDAASLRVTCNNLAEEDFEEEVLHLMFGGPKPPNPNPPATGAPSLSEEELMGQEHTAESP